MATPIEGADRRFGKYQLIAHIASGGMAEIFLASFEALGGFEKTIVVKRMLPEIQRDPHYVEMFLDEARLAARLNHTNVVQIYDMGQIDGRYFIAMEYLAGEALSTVVHGLRKRKKRFPPALAAGVVMQAAEGLHHAHTLKGRDGAPLNLVHRDVSPQNLFVLYDGGVKVVDFGVAKTSDRATKTRTGVLKGKLAYMSPEQVQNKKLDARSDVFSLGVVLWECLTRRRLYRGDSEYSVMQAIAEKDAPSPLTVNTHVPVRLAEITHRALARDRARRYATAAELRAELATYLRESVAEADTVAIGQFMKLLFVERMHTKEELIERAQSAEDSKAQALSSVWRQHDESQTPSVPKLTPTDARGDMNSAAEVPADPIDAVFASAAGGDAPPPLGPQGSRSRAVDEDTELEPTIVAGVPAAGRGRMIAGGGVAVVLLVAGMLAVLRMVDGGSRPPDEVVAPLASAAIDAARETVQGTIDAGDPIDTASADAAEPAPDAAEPTADAAAPIADAAEPAPVTTRPPPTSVAHPHRRPGTLRLKTRPWAMIYYRGKALGESPLVDVELPAGRLKLRAVNEQAGIDKWFAIEIKPGARTTKVLKLK